MWKEFKAFALKGNVLDLTVGVIIGGAFGKIISSLVNDVIMPLLGLVLGGVDFTSLKWVLTPAVMEGNTVVTPENALRYGQFVQNVVDFLIIAVAVFIMVRVISRLTTFRRKKEEESNTSPVTAVSKNEELLTEIRDILRERNT